MKDKLTVLVGESASALVQSSTGPPPRILVVEDDTSIRQLSSSVLKFFGYVMHTARDEATAWEALNSADGYDLLITNNKTPRVTGVELLRKLRAARMVLPVIMVTGALPQEESTRCPWLQPAATLHTHFTPAELMITVNEVLRASEDDSVPFTPPPNWKDSRQPADCSCDDLALPARNENPAHPELESDRIRENHSVQPSRRAEVWAAGASPSPSKKRQTRRAIASSFPGCPTAARQ
jgi:DNA-binding response OmpR family regulator